MPPTRSSGDWPRSASTTSAAACRRRGSTRSGRSTRCQRLRERVESFGITLDMVPLPMSSNDDRASSRIPNILLGQESRARPRDRRHLPDDPQCCARRHSVAEVQPDASRRRPHRANSRARRRAYSTFVYDEAKQDPPLTEAGPVERRRLLGAHHLLSRARRSRWPRNTRCGWRAIRRIPACRPARATAASTPCSASSTG